MQKILLYYKFTPISDPEAVKLWQKSLCDSLNLKGRILVSRHGINGTVGGEIDDLKAYVKSTKQYPGFKDTVFNLTNSNAAFLTNSLETCNSKSESSNIS